MIRDIACTDIVYDVINLPGYNVNQLKKHLKSTSKCYQVVTLMVGTNDCSSDARINTLLEDCLTLLDMLKPITHCIYN